MRKLGLAVIGTGIASDELHGNAYRKLKDRYNLVACCNRRMNKARVFAKKYKVNKVVANVDELLKLKEIEAVSIALPIELSARTALKCLKAGKHVICEKPIAATVGEGRRLVKAASKLKPTLMIGENWFFWDLAEQVRKWVAAGKVGKVRVLEVNQNIWVDTRNQYYQTKWRQKPKHLGGFLVDGGVHLANPVREMFGMPKEVKTHLTKFNKLLPPADTMLSVFKLKKDILGLWKYSFSLKDTGGIPLIRVQGDKGNAELWWHQSRLARPGAKDVIAKGKENNYVSEFKHFYDVVVKGKPLAFKAKAAQADLEFMASLLKGR